MTAKQSRARNPRFTTVREYERAGIEVLSAAQVTAIVRGRADGRTMPVADIEALGIANVKAGRGMARFPITSVRQRLGGAR